MFPNAPSLAILTVILAIAAVSTVGWSVVWVVFAVTLVATALVAVHRSIPRKER